MRPVQKNPGMPPPLADSDAIGNCYRSVRKYSEQLCSRLHPEDFCLQAMENVSPPKWHLAHTSWFFETFILKPYLCDYQVFHSSYESLFNSYYNGVGSAFPRSRRGQLSRPDTQEIFDYRAYVDEQILNFLARGEPRMTQEDFTEIIRKCRLGVNHEQQHQELMLMDVKFNFSCNPLLPVYAPECPARKSVKQACVDYVEFADGVSEIGVDTSSPSFFFDNETPRHRVFLEPFALADRLITNGEYLEFLDDGGYDRSELWLSDGWGWRESNLAENRHPLYWLKQEQSWNEFTLSGVQPLDLTQPVSHVNFYEAEAFARWANARLPTEQEWEVAGQNSDGSGILKQMYDELWQWTASSYMPYPGFRPLKGTLGEYNGKFMCNQMVLKGGSRVTPAGHTRATYRNFFYPQDRWAFCGIRLARNLV